jgi:lipoprotein-releasing system permease protein
MNLSLGIALRHLATRKRQTLVSLAGVAMGVGFFIAMMSLMRGMQEYFVVKVIDSWPHIVVKDEYRDLPRQPAELAFEGAAVELKSVKPRDELRGIRDAKSAIAQISSLPGLYAAPTLRSQVFLRYGSREVSATLVGIEPARERKVTNLERDMVAGKLDNLYSAANGLVIGEGLARKLGASLGSNLTATSPAGAVLKMEVVGLFSTGVVAIDNFESYALLKKAQVLAGRPNVINQIRVRLDDVTTARSRATEIERWIGYKSESWEEAYSNVLGLFKIQNGVMYTAVAAIMVVAAFGIFNIISTVVNEKARDIAIMKSIGLYERDIRRIFLIEGMILGLLGTVLGWALGWALIEVLAQVRMDVEGFIKTQGFILYRGLGSYFIAAAFAVVASSAAAWWPARKAARLRPVDIIRGAA